MGLIQITRGLPPATTDEEIHDVNRTIRYKYEPKPHELEEHEAAFADWLDEPNSGRSLELILRHPEVFTPRAEIKHPDQELFAHPPNASRLVRSLGVAVTPRTLQLMLGGSPHVASSSGGKDGSAADFAADELLDWVGHTGSRAVAFSDVGILDWPDSRDSVTRLATTLNHELIIVNMPHGMVNEWRRRWERNTRRYVELLCAKLIKPWSTVDTRGRFCTKLKLTPIMQELPRRFSNATIINSTGVRRSESNDRLFSDVSSEQPELRRVKLATQGWDLRPIAHWRTEPVFAYLEARGFRLPDSYRLWRLGRHSCVLCIAQSIEDQAKALASPHARVVVLEIVDLEIETAFPFQQGRWLSDQAALAGLLDPRRLAALKEAKERAEARAKLEEQIPPDLLYCEGWPQRAPTPEEARLFASIRRGVAEQARLNINYDDEGSVIARFEELLAEKARRDKQSGSRTAQPKRPKKQKNRNRTLLGALPGSQLSFLDQLTA